MQHWQCEARHLIDEHSQRLLPAASNVMLEAIRKPQLLLPAACLAATPELSLLAVVWRVWPLAFLWRTAAGKTE
jgi:hypothetical protein